jgi:tRNA-2-methylthio-N6-dimethylallyladenosine synthase
MLEENRQGEVLEMNPSNKSKKGKKLYIESYGCQMNFSDSEIVASVLGNEGYTTTTKLEDADLVFLNTCSIRDKAEETIRKRLKTIKHDPKKKKDVKVGVLGCMAERLKGKLLEEEKLVDLVAGPDAYRKLPELVDDIEGGQKAVNVLLSREETYDDIQPVRINSNGVTAFVSIMRGCDNMCTFCVVPFTRGRERSRNAESIISECKDLYQKGYKEVTLLGQNVDSYRWSENAALRGRILREAPRDEVIDFAKLLTMVADISPNLRVRFSTSHPKDIIDEVLFAIRDYKNICNYIHLPAQSGNTRILKKMNRTYTREWYDAKVARIRDVIPKCAISTDIITGFCSESENEHQDTVQLMKQVRYELAYMFFYSERPGTLAQKKFEDDVSEDVKKSRLKEIIDIQTQINKELNKDEIGEIHEVLVEGISKRDKNDFRGRNSQNKVIIFPKEDFNIGDYVNVKVEKSTSATLIGKAVKTGNH